MALNRAVEPIPTTTERSRRRVARRAPPLGPFAIALLGLGLVTGCASTGATTQFRTWSPGAPVQGARVTGADPGGGENAPAPLIAPPPAPGNEVVERPASAPRTVGSG